MSDKRGARFPNNLIRMTNIKTRTIKNIASVSEFLALLTLRPNPAELFFSALLNTHIISRNKETNPVRSAIIPLGADLEFVPKHVDQP